jgi:hypothetical protein
MATDDIEPADAIAAEIVAAMGGGRFPCRQLTESEREEVRLQQADDLARFREAEELRQENLRRQREWEFQEAERQRRNELLREQQRERERLRQETERRTELTDISSRLRSAETFRASVVGSAQATAKANAVNQAYQNAIDGLEKWGASFNSPPPEPEPTVVVVEQEADGRVWYDPKPERSWF